MPDTTWHNLTDISGIGPSTAASLQENGVHFTEDLLARPAELLAHDLAFIDGLTIVNLYTNYIPQARLLRLDEVTPLGAAALVRQRFDYDRLTFSELGAIQQALEEGVGTVGREAVLALQLSAAARRQLATVMVTVLDEDNVAQPEADVLIVDPPGSGVAAAWRFTTNEHGRAFIEFVNPGPHFLVALVDERMGEAHFVARIGPNALLIRLTDTAPEGVTYDEATSGPVLQVTAASRTTVDVASTPDDALFELMGLDEIQAHLTLFFRQRVGLTWRFVSVFIPRHELPADVRVGTLIQRDGGTFIPLSESAHGRRAAMILAEQGRRPLPDDGN